MNWDQIEDDWEQFKDRVKKKWERISHEELDIIEGKKDRLAGKLQEKYGIEKEEAEKQLHEFLNSHERDRKEGRDEGEKF